MVARPKPPKKSTTRHPVREVSEELGLEDTLSTFIIESGSPQAKKKATIQGDLVRKESVADDLSWEVKRSGGACNTRTLGRHVVCTCKGKGLVDAVEASESEGVARTWWKCDRSSFQIVDKKWSKEE